MLVAEVREIREMMAVERYMMLAGEGKAVWIMESMDVAH